MNISTTIPAIQSRTSQGWTAQLRLEYGLKDEQTVLLRNQHRGPLQVQKPLYPEGEVCHTCILHPPGGVVGGDILDIAIVAGAESRSLLTTPGATKFYRSQGAQAIQEQHLTVGDDAVLEWFPQDSIIFPGSNAIINTRIELSGSARFIGWEVLCLGLPVNNQRCVSGSLRNTFALYRDGVPVLLERLQVEGQQDLDSCVGLRGFPVTATFIATCTREELLPLLRRQQSQETESLCGVTQIEGLIVARYLGYSTFAARALLTEFWKILRPVVAERTACIPRIWKT